MTADMPDGPRPLLRLLASMLLVVAPMAGAAPRSAEMPALSGPGPQAIGTDYRELTAGDRRIGVRVWFPAEKPA